MVSGCARPGILRLDESGMKDVPVTFWVAGGAVQSPVVARGRISAKGTPEISFRLLARNDTLQIQFRSRLGNEVARATLYPDSLFLLLPDDGVCYVYAAGQNTDNIMLQTAVLWPVLLLGKTPDAVPTRQRENQRLVQRIWADGTVLTYRRADSLLTGYRSAATGLSVLIQKYETASRRPSAFRMDGPSPEMPIFVTVSEYRMFGVADRFRQPTLPSIRILRPE